MLPLLPLDRLELDGRTGLPRREGRSVAVVVTANAVIQRTVTKANTIPLGVGEVRWHKKQNVDVLAALELALLHRRRGNPPDHLAGDGWEPRLDLVAKLVHRTA